MQDIQHEPTKRVSEIEEITTLTFFLPLSYWLVPKLAFIKITPNMVSFTGMVCGIAAGISYFQYQDYRFAVLGFFLMCVWHILDGADGALARMTNSQSELGKIIDGVCDYIIFISVYVALALAMGLEYGNSIWYLVIAAGISHALQSGAYELQRQEYDYWGYGKKSAELPELLDINDLPHDLTLKGKIAASLNILYAKMQYRISGMDDNFRPQLKNLVSSNPKQIELFRAEYRRKFAPIVKKWGIMSANYRTYAIFVLCLIQQPIIYFCLEILLLNLILFILVQKQKIINKHFLTNIIKTLNAVKNKPTVHGIILSGGNGSRFASKRPKQYLNLAGKAIIEHSIEAFEKNPDIDSIIIVTAARDRHIMNEIILRNSYKKITKLLNGGNSRIESSYMAINSLSDDNDIVIIQDAVRPLVSQKTISNCVSAAITYHAAAVVIPCTDAIFETADGQYLKTMPKRNRLRRSFGPQGFKLGLVRTAHMRAINDKDTDFTEDCAVVLKYNLTDIFLVPGNMNNIKVTYPEDLIMADTLLQAEVKTASN